MTKQTPTLTREQAALIKLYQAAPPAFYREVERLVGGWCCEAVRRMRVLVLGRTREPDEVCTLDEAMRSFDDLLADAERYGLRDKLQTELDDIRARWLFRRNQTRVPNRHAV